MLFPHDQFQAVELSPQELRHLAATSHEFFMEYFLADDISETDHIQDFHLLTFSRFVDLAHTLDVIALPRGHAKTTYLRLAIVYLVFFSDIDFFMYLSATHSAAAASLQVVWDYITSVEGQEMFGNPIAIDKLAPGDGWYEFTVTAYDKNLDPYVKRIILRALGQGQTLRGMNLRKKRPQYAAVDDVEDETAVKTVEGYNKMKTWFDNTFMRALDRRKRKVAQIGNLIGKQTLLNDNLEDPDWRSMRLGVLRPNGEPLWPTLWTKEEIEKDIRASMRRGQIGEWMGEMMNIPANIENGLIAPEKIPYTPRRHPADGRKYATFITIDPAGDRDTGDEGAIVLHTIDTLGVGQQTEYVNKSGMSPYEMAETIYDMCERWDCNVVGCESAMLQKTFLYFFDLYFRTEGVFDMEWVPIQVSKTHKTSRLKIYAAALQKGETTLAEGDWNITQQLMAFDTRFENNLDDLIDAAAFYPYMLENHQDLLYAERAGSTPSTNATTTIPGSTTI